MQTSERLFIKQTLTASLDQVRKILSEGSFRSRSESARAVCREFGLLDQRGKERVAGCARALRELAEEGRVTLPPGRALRQEGHRSPVRLGTAVAEPSEVPTVWEECRLVVVETEEERRTYNELMIREHPTRSSALMVGPQIRYLIGSAHGWLGAVGFVAASHPLSVRDRWMGWDEKTRKWELPKVLEMSRFLLRTKVAGRGLAAQVLARVLERLPDDFESLYGYRPLLVETVVRKDGQEASGRVSESLEGVFPEGTKALPGPEKTVYLTPLAPDFRKEMGLLPESTSFLGIAEGVDSSEWASNEFGGAEMGDVRLSDRLEASAEILGAAPGQSFSRAACGQGAAVKGYYRLIEQPEESGVTVEAILGPHHDRTVARMASCKTVLCLQDGTVLNYTGLAQCEGLGKIGKNQTSASSRGLLLHSVLAVTTEGVPLGVLGAEFSAPPDVPDERPSSKIPVEEKKSGMWIRGLAACEDAASMLPDTRVVCVMDREADFFELFERRQRKGAVELLVRAKNDRTTLPVDADGKKTSLFEAAREAPEIGTFRIAVPGLSARPKKSKQKAKEKREERIATGVLRARVIDILPPGQLKNLAPVRLTVLHLRETGEPEDGSEPLEWFLLTTVEIADGGDLWECVRWYCLRWRIEDWHRVLKSGLKVEALAHETALRLERAVALRLVIGWRIMLMTLLGREQPDLPAGELFTIIELTVLQTFAKRSNLKPPETIGEAVRLVGRLGGHQGRKNDPPPGHMAIWSGYGRLQDLCLGFELNSG